VGDAARLRQVLFNLVGNALKFTDQGRVAVSLTLLSAPGAGPCRVLFHVADTGVGIPGDRLADVFEPFTQADGSPARLREGAGLGLTIVKRLVELMGGEISLLSEPGQGTEVCFSLALEPGTPDRRRAAPKRPSLPADLSGLPRAPGGGRAPLNRLATQRILDRQSGVRSWPWPGTAGRPGGPGRGRLRPWCSMDVQMPVMDGVTATRTIRTSADLGESPAYPIAALTAHAMSGDRERFLAAGMDAYLSKPVELEELKRPASDLRDRERRRGEG
jgi:CheY-like chemotaxis protein/anti-sigma regulatory factor (Ser/Thr protein kinase)